MGETVKECKAKAKAQLREVEKIRKIGKGDVFAKGERKKKKN